MSVVFGFGKNNDSDNDDISTTSNNSNFSNKTKIRIGVRLRPFNNKEITEGNTESGFNISNNTITEKTEILQLGTTSSSISPTNRSQKHYVYDHVFTEECHNENVYNDICKPIVDAAIDGFNSTLFAYGQTSSGKTHTLMGNPNDPGLMIYAVQDAFEILREKMFTEKITFLARMSYIEIYNEKLKDLLANCEGEYIMTDSRNQIAKNSMSDTKLRLRQDKTKGWIIEGNKEMIVNSPEDCLALLKDGEELKHFGVTDMNDHSSRAHTVFRLAIEVKSSLCTTESILNLVDLAGSESQKKANTTGERLKEGININKSLLTLGTVISALADGKNNHVPYRDSVLTKILESSLGGNSMTAIVCAISPSLVNHKESLNTLIFASRAGRIVNKPRTNTIGASDSQIEKYQEELQNLKSQMKQMKNSEERKSLQTMDNLQDLLDISKDIISKDNSSTNVIMEALLDCVGGRKSWEEAKNDLIEMKSHLSGTHQNGRARRLSALGMSKLSAITAISSSSDGKKAKSNIVHDDSSGEEDNETDNRIKSHGRTHYPFSNRRVKLEHPLVKMHQSEYVPSFLRDENGNIPDEYFGGLQVKGPRPPPVNKIAVEKVERVYNNLGNLVYTAEKNKHSPDTAVVSISELKSLLSNATDALEAMSKWEDETVPDTNEFSIDAQKPLSKRYSVIGGKGTTSKNKSQPQKPKKKINKRLSMLKAKAANGDSFGDDSQGAPYSLQEIPTDAEMIKEHGIAKMEEYIWRTHINQVEIKGKEGKELDLSNTEKSIRDLYVALNIAREQTDIMRNMSKALVHEMSTSHIAEKNFADQKILKYESQAEHLEEELKRQMEIPYRRVVLNSKPTTRKELKKKINIVGTRSSNP